MLARTETPLKNMALQLGKTDFIVKKPFQKFTKNFPMTTLQTEYLCNFYFE